MDGFLKGKENKIKRKVWYILGNVSLYLIHSQQFQYETRFFHQYFVFFINLLSFALFSFFQHLNES